MGRCLLLLFLAGIVVAAAAAIRIVLAQGGQSLHRFPQRAAGRQQCRHILQGVLLQNAKGQWQWMPLFPSLSVVVVGNKRDGRSLCHRLQSTSMSLLEEDDSGDSATLSLSVVMLLLAVVTRVLAIVLVVVNLQARRLLLLPPQDLLVLLEKAAAAATAILPPPASIHSHSKMDDAGAFTTSTMHADSSKQRGSKLATVLPISLPRDFYRIAPLPFSEISVAATYYYYNSAF